MSTISTHVLDTALGRPAAGVAILLEHLSTDGVATRLGAGATDADGRLRDLLPAGQSLGAGDYRLRFDVGGYFARSGRETFYGSVAVEFRIADASHYHVPLLVSPFGYATYRGS